MHLSIEASVSAKPNINPSSQGYYLQSVRDSMFIFGVDILQMFANTEGANDLAL